MSYPQQVYRQRKWGPDTDTVPLIYDEPPTMEAVEPEPNRPSAEFFRQMNETVRGHLVAMLAEFLGTTMFLFFGYSAAQIGNEHPDTLRPLMVQPGPSLLQIFFISACFSVSLAANVWIFYRVSGGQFNPAVSFALWLAGAFDWVRLICIIPMQVLGAIAAAGMVSALLPGAVQAENSLGGGITQIQGLFLEMILTFMLIFTILLLAVEKSRATFMAPVAIGLALFVTHMIGINYTGASVNPARTAGVAIVNLSFVPEIWLYFVGPFLGALLAAGLYHLLKAMGYESANPGQDDDGLETYRLVQSSSRAMRPVFGQRPPRPRRSDAAMNSNYYNNYLQEISSPIIAKGSPPPGLRF